MRSVRLALVCAIQLTLAPCAIAQSRQFDVDYGWPSWQAYDGMACWELDRQWVNMRSTLVRLQQPAYFDNPKWGEASSRYRVLNQLLDKKCRGLSQAEQAYPEPPAVDLMPEKTLVDTALKGFRNGRYRAAEKLLLQGSAANYPEAQFNLGMVYYVSGKRDDAMRWLRSAAALGHAEAAKVVAEDLKKNERK